ncbi:glycosyltransferase family 4 protein [Sphingomonas sp. MMS24-J13]|uniref:glycosyltransferase family 4 protein n=1 Tax=Sphingomonas sp. MMS24-J13 TaxID=3238686 RepID=UPI00384D7649
MIADARPGDTEIVLDLSRLVSRILHPTPTGVDRCEMAYARGLIAMVPERLAFAAVHPSAFYGRLDKAAVLRFLDETELRWQHRGFSSAWDRRRFALASLVALRPRRVSVDRSVRRAYVQASPNNLTRPDRVKHILTREQAHFVCLVHDLIPLEYPEYARPGGAALHARRVETIVTLADGIVANSQATLDALKPYLARSGRQPITAVAHLGTDPPMAFPPHRDERPFFVCIGTIEPRKNHLLLLHLWRRMSERHGAGNIPKLLIIGRRGWENEQVIDMLERCDALEGCVEEHNRLPDREVQRLLRYSQGLLIPSFAEGYGMPVSEAIALGVPVVCSDIPALREAALGNARFIDPLDGPGWLAAIQDLASLPVAERVARPDLRSDRSWQRHLQILLDVLDRLGPVHKKLPR